MYTCICIHKCVYVYMFANKKGNGKKVQVRRASKYKPAHKAVVVPVNSTLLIQLSQLQWLVIQAKPVLFLA